MENRLEKISFQHKSFNQAPTHQQNAYNPRNNFRKRNCKSGTIFKGNKNNQINTKWKQTRKGNVNDQLNEQTNRENTRGCHCLAFRKRRKFCRKSRVANKFVPTNLVHAMLTVSPMD